MIEQKTELEKDVKIEISSFIQLKRSKELCHWKS